MGSILSFLKVFFPPPTSLLLNALSLANVPFSLLAGVSEMRGQNMKFSKFSTGSGDKKKAAGRSVPSKVGMFVCYAPALAASLASPFVFPYEGNLRLVMLTSALALHFFKRVSEVLFVHKYSGTMEVKTSVMISLGYFTSTATMLYAQYLLQGLVEPMIDLKHVGVGMFLIGISGNLYHHMILAQLRGNGKGGDKGKYKIPKGGLFSLVICPHYLFEIIEYVSFFFISQTPHSLSVALGTVCYLMGRSCATRQWYLTKFEDFPPRVKALIPYVL